jgi:heme/copper-type cytochrome/quinol oxidase subunit 3
MGSIQMREALGSIPGNVKTKSQINTILKVDFWEKEYTTKIESNLDSYDLLAAYWNIFLMVMILIFFLIYISGSQPS